MHAGTYVRTHIRMYVHAYVHLLTRVRLLVLGLPWTCDRDIHTSAFGRIRARGPGTVLRRQLQQFEREPLEPLARRASILPAAGRKLRRMYRCMPGVAMLDSRPLSITSSMKSNLLTSLAADTAARSGAAEALVAQHEERATALRIEVKSPRVRQDCRLPCVGSL